MSRLDPRSWEGWADEEPWTLDGRGCLEELRHLVTGETPRHCGHVIVDEAQA